MPRAAVQARSQAMHEALIRAGRELIEARTLEEISVADVAKAAGCSVGSFYFRFVDKDLYFRALIADTISDDSYLEEALGSTDLSDDQACARLVHAIVQRYRSKRGLIRAAIKLSMTDPSIWEPFKQQGQRVGDLLVARFGARYSERHIRIALQVLYGTLKNTILVAPGPLNLEDEELEAELLRVFLLVLHG